MSSTSVNRHRWLRALAIVTSVALLLLVWSGFADQRGLEYTERGLQRALVTFAIARGLNAVISVAQGTEVALEPAGVGVTFTPGQVLDPVNDLIEQFSWIMLAAATSLGVQRLLIELFSTTGFNVLLTLAILATAVVFWINTDRPRLRHWLVRGALVLMLLRFAVPAVAFLSEAIYDGFLAERYTQSTEAIEHVTRDLGEANAQVQGRAPEQTEQSFLDQAQRWFQSAAAAMDINAYIARYQAAAAQVSEQVVQLIVLFTVQTILLPLAFLWLIVTLLRRAVR